MNTQDPFETLLTTAQPVSSDRQRLRPGGGLGRILALVRILLAGLGCLAAAGARVPGVLAVPAQPGALVRRSPEPAGVARLGPAATDPAAGAQPAPTVKDVPAAGAEAGVPPASLPAPAPGLPRPLVLASDLFAAPQAAVRPTEVRMSGDYVIGSGDQLALAAFGSVNLARVLKVDRGGKVAIPEVGLVAVDGLTLEAARTRIRAALQRRYSGLDQFSLEVVGLHDVEVMVIGEVRRPGSYLVPSASSPVALLGLAGGPGDNGSYRGIRHMRGGRQLQALDLYKLRFDGAALESRGFQDGDILFVPLAGTRITAVGAFRRSAGSPGVLMELAPGESALEAVHFAGGLMAAASPVLVTVQRTSPAGITTVADVPAEPARLRAFRLCEADVLRALERSERQSEYVEAAGAVAVPGRFAFRAGMKVADLLALGGEGGQLLPGTYRLRGEVLRTHSDGATELLSFDVERALRREPGQDLALQPRDRVELADVADLRLPRRVTILGPLARPGVYDWHAGMRAADLIFRAGVPRLSAERHHAELASLRDGQRAEVRRLDLARLLSTEDHAPAALDDDQANPLLRPYDQITIYENPHFRMHRTVSILGQVERPGPYVIQEDRFTLRQLIDRAGGLTGDAMPAGGIFLRSSAEPGDPSARDPKAAGQRTAPGAFEAMDAILRRLNETRRSKDSGALEDSPLLHGLVLGEMNRLVVDFGSALRGDSRRDVVLQDGDQVFIPRRTDTVYVVGEVASSFSAYHVRPGDRAQDVLQWAGGFTRNADVAQVRLLKADGRVIDSRVRRREVGPGDALLVPQRIRKDIPWQDTLLAMTPLALIYNAIRR